jgi:hypothetical protein
MWTQARPTGGAHENGEGIRAQEPRPDHGDDCAPKGGHAAQRPAGHEGEPATDRATGHPEITVPLTAVSLVVVRALPSCARLRDMLDGPDGPLGHRLASPFLCCLPVRLPCR